MLWLYDNLTSFDFYQIFENTSVVFNENSNVIYSFDNQNSNSNSNSNENFKLNLSNYTYDNKHIYVKGIEQLISFLDIKTNKEKVFSYKNNFIESSANKLSLPIFNFTYKLVDSHRMPNLIESNYNFSYELTLQIYKINQETQYIIENNLSTGKIKKYLITTNIDSVYDFFNNEQ